MPLVFFLFGALCFLPHQPHLAQGPLFSVRLEAEIISS